MNGTHFIVDEGEKHSVGLALDFIIDDCNSDLIEFKAKCNPLWGWDEAKMETVFAAAMIQIAATPSLGYTPPVKPTKKSANPN